MTSPEVGAWQIELRKRNDDPLELDELILHVAKHNGASRKRSLQTRTEPNGFVARCGDSSEPHRVPHAQMKCAALQGVGREMKECKLVDHRPAVHCLRHAGRNHGERRMKPRLVIVDGVRTPFCKAGTDLAHLDAVELGRLAVSALLQRTGLDPEPH